jgi:hypothetical protein
MENQGGKILVAFDNENYQKLLGLDLSVKLYK